MSQIGQRVTQSYHELRGDLRDLTLRVEVLELRDRSQRILHDDITELRSNFGRMHSAIDRFAQE